MFRINYQLKNPREIVPWGEENKSLTWFGLTDGLLWINVGDSVIYEYADEAMKQFGFNIKYNDYQISRFLEDFSETFRFIAEPVPKYLYDNIDTFMSKIDEWHSSANHASSEDYDEFYEKKYEPLTQWFTNRVFDSAHLIGGPVIGAFRYGDNVKIYWNSDYVLEDGTSLWTSPKGIYEMKYNDFVAEVQRFFKAFHEDMDVQVADVVDLGIKDVYVDVHQLYVENKFRKQMFTQKLRHLNHRFTDWDKIKELYDEMIAENTVSA